MTDFVNSLINTKKSQVLSGARFDQITEYLNNPEQKIDTNFKYNIWPNAQRNWQNARAFDEFRSHLVTVGRIDQMRSAFGQTRSAIGQTRAQFTKRCAFGQMPRV